MEVSELRKELVKIHDNNVKTLKNSVYLKGDLARIQILDNTMMYVFGKMWDEEQQDYT